jgi:Putative transposase/Transposase zinc-binding domain
MAHCQTGQAPRTDHLELAEILARHAQALPRLSHDQARVVSALIACRTASLGGHLRRCDSCGHETPFYNSCRNRHCPKCQSLDQALWVEARLHDLLPVPYFHNVFTFPHCLNPFFLRHPRLAHRLLFDAATTTLIDVCRSHLGATPGVIAVLHTWNQLLEYHPHVHCIATGGGLSRDGERWIASRSGFFLPVRKLSKVFRGRILEAFEHRFATGAACDSARSRLRQAAAQPFVVYCKAPMAGPQQVLRYLGRYTHRIAISNERLLAHRDDRVTFAYKDRADGGKRKSKTIPGTEFARRFLLHVVPARFVRVRHYGFLANGIKRSRLAQVRLLLGTPVPPEPPRQTPPESWHETYCRIVGNDPLRCPACQVGRLVSIDVIRPSLHLGSTAPTSRSP